MARKLLRHMTPDEVVGHYETLKHKRIDKARVQAERAYYGGLSAEIQRFALDKVEKARFLALPRKPWQIAAAQRMAGQQGIRIAAGFLRANGWSVEAAQFILNGR